MMKRSTISVAMFGAKHANSDAMPNTARLIW